MTDSVTNLVWVIFLKLDPGLFVSSPGSADATLSSSDLPFAPGGAPCDGQKT
ncbi:hypothetical protein [Mesorhizobium sp. LCM 4577]|uniref:hypothetical protein n=1 Tax=Mesorhizobium sp. LCM 4577 TaxID=1848288 RepID=UPI0012FF612C